MGQDILSRVTVAPSTPAAGFSSLYFIGASDAAALLSYKNADGTAYTVATLAAQTFAGLQTFNAGIAIPTGQSVTGTGTATVTGFATVSATTLTGTLSTAAQPNVTSASATSFAAGAVTFTSPSSSGLATIATLKNSAGTATGLLLQTNQSTGYGIISAYANGVAGFGLQLNYQDSAGASQTGLTITQAGAATFAGTLSTGSNPLTAGAISGTTGAFSDFQTIAVNASTAIGVKLKARSGTEDSQIAFYRNNGTTLEGILNGSSVGLQIYGPSATIVSAWTDAGLAVTGTATVTNTGAATQISLGRSGDNDITVGASYIRWNNSTDTVKIFTNNGERLSTGNAGVSVTGTLSATSSILGSSTISKIDSQDMNTIAANTQTNTTVNVAGGGIVIVRNVSSGGTAVFLMDSGGGSSIIAQTGTNFSVTDSGGSTNKICVLYNGANLSIYNRYGSAQRVAFWTIGAHN